MKSNSSTDEILLGHGLSIEIKETRPKPRFTEATFIKALQDSGIGRPQHVFINNNYTSR